jgi:hypothetical protein
LAVIELRFELEKLVLNGVTELGEVNVAPFVNASVALNEESKLNETPVPPIIREIYIVLPLLEGLSSCSVIVTFPPKIPSDCELLAFTINSRPFTAASASGGAHVPGILYVFVSCV